VSYINIRKGLKGCTWLYAGAHRHASYPRCYFWRGCMLVLIGMHRIHDVISGEGLVKNQLGGVNISLHTSRFYW